MISFEHKRKRHPGASGALLLLVGFSTSTALQLPQALAQPATAKPAKPQFELPAKQRDEFRRFVELSRMENVCKTPLDLKVKDATLDDIIAQVKKLTSTTARIEVREARPVRLTFDVPGSTVGATLGSVGSLAGCKVWVFVDHLLLAPEDKLSASEKADVELQMGGDWAKNVQAGGSSWYAKGKGKDQLLTAMVELFERQSPKTAADKAAPLVTRFGDLSPDGQAIMKQLVVWANEDTRITNPQFEGMILSPGSKITFTGADPNNKSDPNSVSLFAKNPADSDPYPPTAFWFFTP